MSKERKLSSVPLPVMVLLSLALALQIGRHQMQEPLQARAVELPYALPSSSLNVMSLGEPVMMGKFLMLWLQAFDNQPGISIPFRELDYTRVISWLERILILDPEGQYPLLAASRLYGEVPDEGKQRQMLEFVRYQFLLDPNVRWQWLAHAAFIAKHRLKDLSLARAYAHDLAVYATGESVPGWAKQMEIFVLEELGELQEAKILLGGLLESGVITDEEEWVFLADKLKQLEMLEQK